MAPRTSTRARAKAQPAEPANDGGYPGHEWAEETHVCPDCGGENVLHAQPAELLDTPDGVVWECRHCGARHRLGGGVPVAEGRDWIVECQACHSTFTADAAGVDGDEFTCPVCSTPNRVVSHADSAYTTEVAK